MVEPSIETHLLIMAVKQSRSSRVCRSQQRYRARDAPVLAIHVPRGPERRRSARARSTGTALIHGSFVTRARIIDLAVGGLRLLVDDAVTAPDVGAHVSLDVRLDGLGRWLHMIGSVARVDARGSGAALVIELLVVPPDFEDLVQDELLSGLECVQLPRLLLVDHVHERRELVAAAFRATGFLVIEVGSPLEAIAEIDQSRLHLWGVVIADTKLAAHADHLRRFLGEMYPDVPLIDVDGLPDLSQIDTPVGERVSV